MIRLCLVTLFGLTGSLAIATPFWPTSELQDYVDYRKPAPLSAMASEFPFFRDVPYPRGVLFSTTTGSIYWYDEQQDTVTCILPLNGQVTGLSMSADQRLYSFSYEGTPYLWRLGPSPQAFTELDVPGTPALGTHEYSLQVNATGTMAILNYYGADEYESYSEDSLIDLKTMTVLRTEEGGLEFTPDGKYVVTEAYDYGDPENGDEPRWYWELSNFAGDPVKREYAALDRDPGRYDSSKRWEEKRTPGWYTDRYRLDGGHLWSWEQTGLPPAAPFVPFSGAHTAGLEDGLEYAVAPDLLQLTRKSASGEVLWRRKMNQYRGGTDLWLDDKGRTLLVLTSRPGEPQQDGRPGPRMVLRQYDWTTGEPTAADIDLLEPSAESILEWDPGRFVAIGLTTGGRLEYWFGTKKLLRGNGTTNFRGRSITSFYPSMTGTVSFDKSGQVFTLPRFPDQVGGIVELLVRDDQKLVAAIDEMGQVGLWRVDDGAVLGVTSFDGNGNLDPHPFGGLTEKDFRAAISAPNGISKYPAVLAKLKAGPRNGQWR